MENYKIKPTIEPTNKYKKAKMDLLQAMMSIGELSPQEREQLATELFGVEKVAAVCNLMQRYWG